MIQLIIDLMHEVMADHGLHPSPLEPDMSILAETPLDSLDLAIVIVKLEEMTGKDPFKQGFIPFSTIRELASLYEK